MVRIPHQALRQEVTIEPYLGQGARGPTFGDPIVVRASIQSIENFRVEWKDEEHLASVMIIVRPEVGKENTPLGSRVTHDGDVYRLVKRIPIPDWYRPSHIELIMTSWGSQ